MKGRILKNIKFLLTNHLQPPQKHDQKLENFQDFKVSHPKDENFDSKLDIQIKDRVTPTTIESRGVNREDEDLESEFDVPEDLSTIESKDENSVIFYTTSLRGIRKTFQDCVKIRFLLESLRVKFEERDVSMDLEFRQELWRLLGGKVIPPMLFVNGKCIGGADEVVELHEVGKFQKLLEGTGLGRSECDGCNKVGFVVCVTCNGSCRVFVDGEGSEKWIRCSDCNENGLVKCPICM